MLASDNEKKRNNSSFRQYVAENVGEEYADDFIEKLEADFDRDMKVLDELEKNSEEESE